MLFTNRPCLVCLRRSDRLTVSLVRLTIAGFFQLKSYNARSDLHPKLVAPPSSPHHLLLNTRVQDRDLKMAVATRASTKSKVADKTLPHGPHREAAESHIDLSLAERYPNKKKPRRSSAPRVTRSSLSQTPATVAQDALPPTSHAGRGMTDLTWQQHDLLRQHRSRTHRRTKSAAAASTHVPSLPPLRVTSQGEIVIPPTATAAAAEAIRKRKARRSLPSPHSLNKKFETALTTSHPSAVPNCPTSHSQAYAGPSFFRSPLPQSLPTPCFPRSTSVIAVGPASSASVV